MQITDFAAFDIESTGKNPDRDRIVEITVAWPIEVDPLDVESQTWLINPGCPIPAEATEVHGITDQDVADSPRFLDVADEILGGLEGRHLMTYYGRSFDAVMLNAELERAGKRTLTLDELHEIDLCLCWKEFEPRTLESCVKRYTGADHDGHRAEVDATVLFPVLQGMALYHRASLEDMAKITKPDSMVDRDGKFYRDDEGVVRFAFSKNKDRPVHDERGMLEWMLRNDFSIETKLWVRKLLDETRRGVDGSRGWG